MLADDAFVELASRCDDLRHQLAVVDVRALSRQGSARNQAALAFSASYVWSAAALERFVRAELALLSKALSAAALAPMALRPSLLSVMLGGSFQSLSEQSGMKSWRRRAELLEASCAGTPAVFTATHQPLDRKTL